MTPAEYHDWATQFRKRFGIDDAPGAEMTRAWFAELTERKATVAELVAAASRLGKFDNRSQFRGALLSALTMVRFERKQREQTERYMRGGTAMTGSEVTKMLRSRGLLGRKRGSTP